MSRALLVSLLVVCAAAPARANPISIDVLRARQVPRTHHVQITFGVDATISADYTPGPVKRDGAALAASWVDPGTSYRTNTGSGVRDTRARQLCDCDVAVGSHAYVVTVTGGGRSEDLTATVEVVASLPDAPDAKMGGDMFPWDIPDPVEIQGIDCAASCAAAPGADMAAGNTVVPAPSTCSVGGAAGFGAVALAAVAGLALVLRRRRG